MPYDFNTSPILRLCVGFHMCGNVFKKFRLGAEERVVICSVFPRAYV